MQQLVFKSEFKQKRVRQFKATKIEKSADFGISGRSEMHNLRDLKVAKK
jgi:hypothetical protein